MGVRRSSLLCRYGCGFSGRWPRLAKYGGDDAVGARCISFPAKQPPMVAM
jgi:hypothetical protein